MKVDYKGIIKGSRTLDAVALAGMLDAAMLGMLAYSPQDWGVSVPLYGAVRIALGILQAWLRFQTTTPVGEKE